MRHLMIMLFLVVAMALGCGEKNQGENLIDKVPANLMTIAKENLPDVTFDQAWKTSKGNYEIRGKMKSGRVRDIQLTPEGKVVEID